MPAFSLTSHDWSKEDLHELRRGFVISVLRTTPCITQVYSKIRRDYIGIEKTYMGKALAGQILTERDSQGEGGGELVLRRSLAP
jgi:hypothetical protein